MFCRFFKRKHLKPCLSLNCALRSLSLQPKDLEEGELGLLYIPGVKGFSLARKRNILLRCFQCSGRAVPSQLRVPQPHLLPLIWLGGGGESQPKPLHRWSWRGVTGVTDLQQCLWGIYTRFTHLCSGVKQGTGP